MSELLNILTIPFLLAMFLAINMGGSGTAPSFSAAYGANVVKQSLIPGLFGVMVLAGALIAGKEVSLTLGKGLLEQSYFTPLNTSIILFSIGLSLLIANLLGVPQSTSQSTVLSIAGAATALDGLNTDKLFYEIIPAWIILPIIAFFIMLFISKWVFPLLKAKVFTADYRYLKQHKGLKAVLILSSLYVAFSIGANNVANAAAPIASLTANEIGHDAIQNFCRLLFYPF
jgi:sulfate permease